MPSNRINKLGFTLIELLTVIAVSAILAAILLPLLGQARSAAYRSQCASNMRQLGTALRLFADEHEGYLPGTAHFNVEDSWIFSLAPYLDNVHEVRICPVDPRAEKMRETDYATSYIMNDLIFTPAEDEFGRPIGADYRHIDSLQTPSLTKLAFIEADHRGISPTDDHTHAGQWANNWQAVVGDIAPDRHRSGSRNADRTNGSANYLYADGHVATLAAGEIRRRIEAGENIALPPEARD